MAHTPPSQSVIHPNDKGSISAVIAQFYGQSDNGLADRAVVAMLNILFAFAVALTYPVQFFAAVEVLEGRVGLLDKPGDVHAMLSRQRAKQAAFRVLVVLFTFAVAFIVPKLGPMIALFGALFGGTIELMLPPLLFLASGVGRGQTRALATNAALLAVGVAAVGSGTYAAWQELTASDTGGGNQTVGAHGAHGWGPVDDL